MVRRVLVLALLMMLALPASTIAVGGPRVTGSLAFRDCHGTTTPVTATVSVGRRTVRATGTYTLRVPPGTHIVVATMSTVGFFPSRAQRVQVGHDAATVDFVFHISCPFRR